MAEDKRAADRRPRPIDENVELERRMGTFDTMLATYRYRAGIFLVLLIFAAILVALYPRAFFYAKNVFNSTVVPADYKTVNEYIAKNGGDARIMWVPFIEPEHMYYDWAPEKRISPFNVWSSNASLNNMQEAYDAGNFFYWLSDVFQKTSFDPVQLADKDLLPPDTASKLFIPFAARYMIFDSSIKGYTFDGYFDRDTSLKTVFRTPLLTVYTPSYNADLIRVAEKTLKVNSFFDILSVSEMLPATGLGRVGFEGKKPVTASFESIDKEHGLLDMNDYRKFIPMNSSFEDGSPADPATFLWSATDKPSFLLLSKDASTRSSGTCSLKAVNLSTTQYDIGWIRGAETPVKIGDFITFDTNLKYRNSEWTAAVVEGYRKETGEWVQIAQCPSVLGGSSDWRHFSCSFIVPEGITAVRPALSAGWVLDEKKGPAISWFDDIRIGMVEPRLYLDMLASSNPPEVSFKKINGEKYVVHIKKATKPFLLVFGEAFDPFWVARTSDGKVIQPAPLYSTINSYQMDKTGDYDLTIEYQPQKWYLSGRVVSVAVVIILVIFILYDWKLRGKKRGRAAVRWGLSHAKLAGSRIREAIDAQKP